MSAYFVHSSTTSSLSPAPLTSSASDDDHPAQSPAPAFLVPAASRAFEGIAVRGGRPRGVGAARAVGAGPRG